MKITLFFLSGFLLSFVGYTQSNSWEYVHDKDLYIVSDAGDDFWFFRKMDFVNTGTDTLSLAVELLYESIIYKTPPADSTEEWAWSYCVTGHCNDHMKPFDQHDPILPQDTGWHDINLQHNYSVGQGTFALKHYDYKVPEQLRVIDTMYVTICWDLISQGGGHDHCTGEKLGSNISFINSKELLGQFKIYPNPAKDLLEISFGAAEIKSKNIEVEIYDLNGKIVLNKILSSGVRQLSLQDMPFGVYMVKVTADSKSRIEQLIIE